MSLECIKIPNPFKRIIALGSDLDLCWSGHIFLSILEVSHVISVS